jgi:hypothetical protein
MNMESVFFSKRYEDEEIKQVVCMHHCFKWYWKVIHYIFINMKRKGPFAKHRRIWKNSIKVELSE